MAIRYNYGIVSCFNLQGLPVVVVDLLVFLPRPQNFFRCTLSSILPVDKKAPAISTSRVRRSLVPLFDGLQNLGKVENVSLPLLVDLPSWLDFEVSESVAARRAFFGYHS